MRISKFALAVAVAITLIGYFAGGPEQPDSSEARVSAKSDVNVESPRDASSAHATGKLQNIFFMGMGKETARHRHSGERGFEEI